MILSNDYSDESNNKTNTNNNIINSERVPQIRRSYRIRNLKKVTKYFNKTKQKYKRDLIQITTKEKRVRNRKENMKTQQTNIVERTGRVVLNIVICFRFIMFR